VSAFDALLAIKLRPPPLGPSHMARPRLVERLDGSQPVVVVVAPAGFGKTSLITAWAAARGRAPSCTPRRMPSGWWRRLRRSTWPSPRPGSRPRC
jgi:hypothetical protein